MSNVGVNGGDGAEQKVRKKVWQKAEHTRGWGCNEKGGVNILVVGIHLNVTKRAVFVTPFQM